MLSSPPALEEPSAPEEPSALEEPSAPEGPSELAEPSAPEGDPPDGEGLPPGEGMPPPGLGELGGRPDDPPPEEEGIGDPELVGEGI